MRHGTLDVRFGSKADATLLNFDVRFTPESGKLGAEISRNDVIDQIIEVLATSLR